MIRKLLLSFACVLTLTVAHAQQQLQDIVNSIKNNQITDVTRYFDNIVPITLNNVQTVYSRTQAEIVLKDFFNKNPAKDLNVENSGSPDVTSKFLIGSFTGSNGKYSLYILLKLKDNSTYMLQEIRLNKL